MKYFIHVDEWYPVLSVEKEKPTWAKEITIELTEEQYAYIKKVFDEFDRMQDKLHQLTKI